MKRETVYYAILTLIITALLFFETDLFRGEKTNVSKVIEIEKFEKLNIEIECDIFVSLGDEQKVVFEGPANYIDKVNASNEDGVLDISCKATGLFASLFGTDENYEESMKIYVNLTSADQLIKPEKGNLITNEALRFTEKSSANLFSLNTDLTRLLSILGMQAGHVMIR